MKFDGLSSQVIGCAVEVHKTLGPGLLESAYEQCLAHELHTAGLYFVRQKLAHLTVGLLINFNAVMLRMELNVLFFKSSCPPCSSW